jgi:RNA polymerase sigma factor for flagellar operon FliA
MQVEQLIADHMYLAEQIGRSEWLTATHALDKQEMLSLAYFGLVDAANRWEGYCAKKNYDPGAVQFFKVFARLRIRGTIRDHLRNEDREKGASRTLRTKAKKLKEAGQDEGLPVEILSERTGFSVADINKVNARLGIKRVSLDAPIASADGDMDFWGDQVQDDIDTESNVFVNEIMDTFVSTFKILPPDQQVVIALCYYGRLDIRKVAEELGIPEAKVSQLHVQAVNTVQQAMYSVAQERG